MFSEKQIIRPAELAQALNVSTVTLWNWRRTGVMPEPISFGPRFIGWPGTVLNEWLQSQAGGQS